MLMEIRTDFHIFEPLYFEPSIKLEVLIVGGITFRSYDIFSPSRKGIKKNQSEFNISEQS